MESGVIRAVVTAYVGVCACLCVCMPVNAQQAVEPVGGSSLNWRTDEYVRISDGRIVVETPERFENRQAFARAKIDLSAYDFNGFKVEIRARSGGITTPPNPWNGVKVMVEYEDVVFGERFYPQAQGFTNATDWCTLAFAVSLPGKRAREGWLLLGLENVSGQVEFDLSTLRIEYQKGHPTFRVENRDYRINYPERVKGLPQLKGVMLGAHAEEDLKVLSAMGVKIARYQMACSWKDQFPEGDGIAQYRKWMEEKLVGLEKLLPLGRKYDIRICVDYHLWPGGADSDDTSKIFTDGEFQDLFVAEWEAIARRFKGNHDIIYGYDLINEPLDRGGHSYDFQTVMRRCAEAVRKIDPDTPIVYECNFNATPCGFGFLSPLRMDNVIYSVHVYQPMGFTHQGILMKRGDYRPVAYPNAEKGWDKDFLRRELKPVRDFQLQTGARIYVGEFSAAAYAPGAERYLSDLCELFLEYGWDWSYHAFRESTCWSLEHEGESFEDMRPAQNETRRAQVIRRFLKPSLREQFKEPPSDTKLQTWYHWMTPAITEKSLIADLEAMSSFGIGTAHVFAPCVGYVPGKVLPYTEEWYALWTVAVREARKRGMKLGFHNCPGWSSSGGKWIRPEDSMKRVVSSATDAALEDDAVRLAQPPTNMGFYRDIAVWGFSARAPVRPMRITGDFPADFEGLRTGITNILTHVGKDDAGCSLILEYAKPFSPTTLLMGWDEPGLWLNITVQASVDGNVWQDIGSRTFQLYCSTPTPKIIALSKCRPSRFFRVRMEPITAMPQVIGFKRKRLRSVEFSTLPLVVDLDHKNGELPEFGYQPPGDKNALGLSKSSMVDLSKYLRSDGMVDVKAAVAAGVLPRQGGSYRILRIGYTTTGKCCAPSHENVCGLECDKLSRRGLNAHWPELPHKMKSVPGAEKTVEFATVDSFEVGGQNWTEEFPDEFLRRRGYDLRPYLPAMVGYVVETGLETAKFLYDVQLTIAELFAENYYKYFSERCHREGLASALEAYGGGFDCLQCFATADVPMGEFWIGHEPHGTRSAASAGHLYGRSRIGAESFTTDAREGRWQATPHQLRIYGDRAWLEGVSQLVCHSYLQQPMMNVQPGISLEHHGTQLNRNTTWWSEGKWWAQYVQRGQYILQSGQPQADLLILSGDGIPNRFPHQEGIARCGYSWDFCSAANLRDLHADAEGVRMPGGRAYPVLWLGAERYLRVATLKEIRRLLSEGARIAGVMPDDTPSLGDDPETWKALVKEIWLCGRDNMRTADSADSAIKAYGIRSPIESDGQMLKGLHRVIEGRDFYYVLNWNSGKFDGGVSFAAVGRPERWDAKTGQIVNLPWYADDKGRVKTRLILEPDESAFVSFRAPEADERPQSAWDGPMAAYTDVTIRSARYESQSDVAKGVDVTSAVREHLEAGRRTFLVHHDSFGVCDPAGGHFKRLCVEWTSDGAKKSSAFNEGAFADFREFRQPRVSSVKVVADLSRGWRVSSFSGKNPPVAPLAMDPLASWTDSEDERLRYFSGRAMYQKDVKSIKCKPEGVLSVDLGDVHDVANVYIDGRFVTCLWEPPYVFELPKSLVVHSGVRPFRMSVEVVNTWPNRMIGDARRRKALPPEPKGSLPWLPKWVEDDRPDSGNGIYTWTNFNWAWSEADALLPAGLVGPVRLVSRGKGL